MNEKTDDFFTGGWDLTIRLLKLLFIEKEKFSLVLEKTK